MGSSKFKDVVISKGSGQINLEFHVSIPENDWDKMSAGDIDVAVRKTIESQLVQCSRIVLSLKMIGTK